VCRSVSDGVCDARLCPSSGTTRVHAPAPTASGFGVGGSFSMSGGGGGASSHASDSGALTLCMLNSHMVGWSVQARVFSKSAPREYSNERGTGKIGSIVVIDGSASMKVSDKRSTPSTRRSSSPAAPAKAARTSSSSVSSVVAASSSSSALDVLSSVAEAAALAERGVAEDGDVLTVPKKPNPKKDNCAKGDAFEKKVLDAVLKHEKEKVQHGVLSGQSSDKLGDLYFILRGDGKSHMVQCRSWSEDNTARGTGVTSHALKKFLGVLFVFLNAKCRTFYVLMPEDYVRQVGKTGWNEKMRKIAITYGEGSNPPHTEEEALVKVAEKIVKLLPHSKEYTPTLSPNHKVEMKGMKIIRQVVAKHGTIFENAEIAKSVTTTDLTFRGEEVQVKAATKPFRGSTYQFKLHHGRAGTETYEDGTAFIFVVTTCTDRLYYVPAEEAKKLTLVEKGAPWQIYLPHPAQCAADHPDYLFLVPPRA
jgi:hypothetical protein